MPELDPARSRGGIHELELAIDVMAAYYNDAPARLPVNLPNTDGVLPGFDEDTVVEVWCDVDGKGAHPVPQRPLPHAVRGITQTLAEFQRLAAEAAWGGDPRRCRTGPRRPSVRPQPERRRRALRRPRVRQPRLPARATAAVTPSAQPLYLGVDAGNSKTVAVLADAAGTVLGYGRGGCGDIYGRG